MANHSAGIRPAATEVSSVTGAWCIRHSAGIELAVVLPTSSAGNSRHGELRSKHEDQTAWECSAHRNRLLEWVLADPIVS
jgi:hypothetical protein